MAKCNSIRSFKFPSLDRSGEVDLKNQKLVQSCRTTITMRSKFPFKHKNIAEIQRQHSGNKIHHIHIEETTPQSKVHT